MEVCQRTQVDLSDVPGVRYTIPGDLMEGLCIYIPQDRDTCIHVFCGAIRNSQAIELSLVPVNGWIKKTCVYTQRVVFSSKGKRWMQLEIIM